MKKLLLVFVSFLLASAIHAQLSKKISISAGELGTVLNSNELAQIDSLTLLGTIDARDFVTMRDQMPLLKKIDLKDVSIVYYYGTDGTDLGTLRSYGADTVPVFALKTKANVDSIFLPSTISGIGESAFKDCEALKSIHLPNGIHKIENDVFSGCFSLNTISLPSSLIEIGKYSFLGCGITTISFPTTLQTIGYHAFENSTIQAVSLPTSLQSLDEGAFSNCNNLESAIIPPSITIINQHLFYNCQQLKFITLPNTITAINDYAFESCSSLKSIALPNSVTSVGPYAFSSCIGLQTFNIPYKTKLNVIGTSAFAGCSSLVSIEFPENMSVIGNFAFAGCASLTSVKVHDTIPFVFNQNDVIFANLNYSTCSLYVPSSAYAIYGTANVWMDFYQKQGYSLQNKVITLSKEGELSTQLTASELIDITDLTISGLIDARDFKTMSQDMPNLHNIDLSDATIVGYSGTGGPSFGDNVYPANTIPQYSFSNISSLENIILPNNATKIDQYAFRASKASLFIPASITDLGTGVFAESSVAITIDANNTKFIVEQDVLMNKDKTDLYYCSPSKSGYYAIPSTVTTIHEYCFYGCIDISELIFQKGLIEIGNYAFSGSGIYNFNLPQTVEKIGAAAFSNCPMSTMILPPKVSMLNGALLQSCSNLSSVSLPVNAKTYGSDIFLNSTAIQNLQVYNPTPVDLSLNQSVFNGINETTCVLIVPFESLVAYKNAEVWNTFTSISERSGLRLLKKSITVDNHGGNDTIHFKSNSSWTVSTNVNWINIASSSAGYGDSSVIISILPNQATDREAYIYFSISGGPTDTVKISQKYECTPKPTIVGKSTVCLGDKLSLSVNSTNTIEWFDDITLTNKLATSATYDVTPTANSSLYVVESSSVNCSSPATKVDIVVNVLPTFSANVSKNDVCPNTDVTFTGSSSSQLTYKWSNSIVDNVPYTVYKSLTYTVTGTDINGCNANSSINIIVKPVPTIIAIASKPTVCLGDSITVIGQGGISYVWDHGVTNNVLFSPKQSDYYIVTGTDINGCTGENYVSIVVNPLPTISATVSKNDVCPNTELTFDATSLSNLNYTWSNAISPNVPISVTTSNIYTVTGTDITTGCKASASINVVVKPFPTITAIASMPTLCLGEKLTLNGQGGVSYVWNNSVTDNISFTPSQSDWYYVTGTDVDGCKNTASVEVLVNQLPTISTSVSQNDVCPNTEITFNAASTYTMSYSWSDAVSNNVPYTVTNSKNYTVTGTDLTTGCKTSASINVVVKPFPTITAIASKPTLCQGEKLTLNGQGGVSYDWSNGITDNISFTPSQTDWYYVTGTDVDGCKNTASVEVLVNSLPTISVNASPNDSITKGDLVTLTASATTQIDKYIWDNGITNSVAFSPSTTQIYTVTATDFNACITTASIKVDVKKPIDLQYGLVAYYPFDGSTVDMSGNGNDANNNGAISTSDRFGNTNSAYQFDGINNYMSAQGFNVTGDWTLNAWYLADRNDFTLQYILSTNYATSWGNGLAVHGVNPTCSWNNNIHLFYDGSGTCDNSIAGGEFKINSWYHSVLVKSGNQYSLYINNKLINSVIGTDINITSLFIGKRADGYFSFNGKVDDIRLYNRAITISEIDSLYHENGYVDPNQTLIVNAGELSSKLSKDEKNGIVRLILSGNIDARDFKTMRDSMPNLKYIDLSAANVVAYSGQNGTNFAQITGTLPDYMTFDENTIPLLAFKNKGLIDTILLPSSIVNIGNSAFSYCNSLNYMQLPQGVENIDNYAFQFCKFSSITLPTSIKSLGTNVFISCTELLSITIPDNIVSISESMFAGCSKLETLTLHPNIISINDYAFSDCENLQTITIPQSTNSIGRFAFWNCKKLTAISFVSSSKVQIIGEGAFTSCIGLTSFIAPSSLTTIGKTAFMDCYNLSTFTIPENVSLIGDNAFWNCTNLSTINALSIKPVYLLPSASVFNNVNVSNCTLLVQYGSKIKYDTASVWKDFIIKEIPKPEKTVYVTSPGSLSTELNSNERQTLIKLTITGTIDARDFKTMRDSMPMLREIDINQAQIVDYSGTNGTGSGSVNYMANQVPIQAFVSKSTLNSVVLPYSVNSIANAAFEYCSNLSYVDYPSTITSIGAEAFYGTKLFEIFKSSSVSVINQATFKNCTELSMVSISSTVTTINSEAFANCSALKTLHVYAKVPPVLVSDAFTGVDKTNCKVYVPVGTLSSYKADAKWKTFFSIEEYDQSFAPYFINSTIPDQYAMNGAMFYPLDFRMYIGDNNTSYDKLKFTFESNPFVSLTSMNGMYFPKQVDSTWTGSTKVKCTVTNDANLSLDFDIYFVQNNLLKPLVLSKPTCSFSASKLYLKMNQSTKFYSQNKDALTIEWTFEGGTPATSTSVSPTVTYDTTGVFSVTLKAVNTFGEVVVNKKSYIYVSALSISDSTICNGDSVTISVLGSGYTSYSWNTIPAQSTSSIKVSPKTTTKYKVTMKKGLISMIDSVTISLAKKPELGNDTTFCDGASIQINPGAFAKYYWNDDLVEGNASLLVSKSGKYKVKTIDVQGCVASDSIIINPLYSKPTVNIGKDSTFCWKKKLTLDAGTFKEYLWSTGKTSQTILADTTALYSVTVTDNHSCTNADTISIKVIVPIIPDIAVVTLSSTNKNIVAWEPMNNKGIKQYHIWKETESSVFEIIKTINKTDSTYYIDQKSNPISISSRYALSTVDSACENESSLSKIHKTMHLSCKYDGKKVTATWNNYVGLTISKYQIYRAETGKDLQLYATVDASTGIQTSWDDPKPIGLNSYYQVQFDLDKKVTPSALKSDSGPFSVSLSNMAESELVGVDLETIGSVSIYPNPAQDKFSVSMPTETKFTVTVLDVLNQAVKRQSGIEKLSIDCSDLQAGMYLLRIVSGDVVSTKSIMIVH